MIDVTWCWGWVTLCRRGQMPVMLGCRKLEAGHGLVDQQDLIFAGRGQVAQTPARPA